MSLRRYRYRGDVKPNRFIVGDMFLYDNGETAIVTSVFDSYEGKSKYGPQWTLRLMWTPGQGGSTENYERHGNREHGVLRTNMFNMLSYRSGPWLIPAKANDPYKL